MTQYDVIVMGLGAMGSACAWQLAKRGARVLGIDRYAPPHTLGSSHGGTRITRLAIGEGAHYTPLVTRSHEIWREIEGETGTNLLTQCGGLIISSDDKQSITHVEGFFHNTLAAARAYDVGHELLDAAGIRARFPQFQVDDGEYGYYEPSAGFVRPEACIAAQLDLAGRRGAEFRMNDEVMGFDIFDRGVVVAAGSGEYEAAHAIVAAGAWLPEFLGGEFMRLLSVFRQVQYWYDVAGDDAEFAPGRFPVFIWELRGSQQGVYGFPLVDGRAGGLKMATEYYRQEVSPESVLRQATPNEIVAMTENFVAPNLKGIGPHCLTASVCLYTVAPDFEFVIDRLPESERVTVVSACSGHGFKHSAAIGEALAERILEGRSRLDLSPFSLKRFT